jgi:hypothetical protein
VTKPFDMHPTTDGEVFQMLHGLFGIGDYDEDDKRPWHKFQTVEVIKIKAIRTKRRWSFGEFADVARYCATRGIPVTKAWDLLQYHAPAMLERANNARRQREAVFQDAVDLELAAGLPDSQEWADRLGLAVGHYREELLEEWVKTRQRTLQERLQ